MLERLSLLQPLMATHPPSEKPLGVNEGLTLASERVLTDGGCHNLPTHVQSDGSTDVGLDQGHSLTAIPKNAWARFNGRGRRRIGFLQSIKAVVASSCAFVHRRACPRNLIRIPDLNILLLFLPFAWLSHFERWNENMTFACGYRPCG